MSIRLTTLALCALSFACSSNGPPELTDEQRLGLYLENAFRYYEMNDLDRAADQALRALEIEPRNERFLLILGKVFQRRGSTDDILKAEQIFRGHPNQDDYRIRLGLGEALERKGLLMDEASRQIESGERYTDAADPDERARELAEGATSAWKESYDAYEDSLELHSGGLDATNGLLRVCALLGRDEESIEWGGALIETLHGLNRLYRNQLQEVDISAVDEANWRSAILANEELEVKTRLHIASLHRRLSRDREAIAELDHIIALNPELAAAHARRAQINFALGEYSAAKNSLERFLELEADKPFDDPEVRRAYDLLNKIEIALGHG
ncbi:MAG: hypothetical protein GY711_16165 [bacterium]|nr:hypothetical protein [bacterium]